MASKKDYYERKQLKHRAKYGKLEKRKELITRLKKIKEHKSKIAEAKEEICNVTGKEYFFKYNSLKKVDGKVAVIEYDSKDELIKKKVFVDKEIIRVENKLKDFLMPIKNKRYAFDEDGTKREVKTEINTECNDKLADYKNYLSSLVETKKQISEKLN
ncbi:hypothetical protein P3W45_000921 [Vairimorpha bombi]|jgi:U3 small nucleolar RNA-associated protein 11